MSLTYRTRRRLRRWITTLSVIAIVAVLAFSAWMVWVDRYITYTRQGAVLDFGLSQDFPEGTLAEAPVPSQPVSIVVKDPNQEQELPSLEQTPISGYYVSTKALKKDIPGIMSKLENQPAGTAVLLDMKTIKGAFYYDTSVGSTVSDDVDLQQINVLLEFLAQHQFHAIARVPAFRDWEYGLNNVPQGLPKKGGNGSLWMDDQNCYWLDPTNEKVLDYLIQIVTELKGLGFDEVVFSDFRFPDTDKIKFEEDKTAALTSAAATLVEACATERFFVSFYGSDFPFRLPQGNARVYMKDVDAAAIPQVLTQVNVSAPEIQLLFQTEANDTRFNDYCVLRPLDNAL